MAIYFFRASFIKQLLKAVNEYDRQILQQPDFETAFCETMAECFAQGSDGLVRDSELLYRRWAFDVRCSVFLWCFALRPCSLLPAQSTA